MAGLYLVGWGLWAIKTEDQAAAGPAADGPAAPAEGEPPASAEPPFSGLALLGFSGPGVGASTGIEPRELVDPVTAARRPISTLPLTGHRPAARAEPVTPLLDWSSVRAFGAEAERLATAWAQGRRLGLSSVTGIALALAVCAAAWFSAGDRTGDLRAVAALGIGYLGLLAGRRLGRQPQRAGPELGNGDRLRVPAGLTGPMAANVADGLILGRPERLADSEPGAVAIPVWPGRAADRACRRQARPDSWLAALGWSVAESVVYAGLAMGAAAEHWTGTWQLGIAVLSMVAVRDLMTAGSTPPGLGDPSGPDDTVMHRVAAAVLSMPPGGRVLLVCLVAPVWGPRAALLALLDWAIIAVGYGIAGRARTRPDSGGRATVLRLRDDGALARALGGLVRGTLLPLPPAVLGLAAVSTLAVIGLRGLPGILIVGPAVVMLLAASGASNRHAGRFDWLVPVLLLGAQLLYLAATGLAVGVPDPIVFVLCAALLLHYQDLAFDGGPTGPSSSTWLGWEGRMLLIGFGAALGIAIAAYLLLTLYLVTLLGAKLVTSYPAFGSVAGR